MRYEFNLVSHNDQERKLDCPELPARMASPGYRHWDRCRGLYGLPPRPASRSAPPPGLPVIGAAPLATASNGWLPSHAM